MNVALVAAPLVRGERRLVGFLILIAAAAMGAVVTATFMRIAGNLVPGRLLLVAATFAIVAFQVLGRDASFGAIVPHWVSRLGAVWVSVTFGLVLGSGVAAQRRGLWLGLVLVLGSPWTWATTVVIAGTYAIQRCSTPLLLSGCNGTESALNRVRIMRALGMSNNLSLALSCVSAIAVVGLMVS